MKRVVTPSIVAVAITVVVAGYGSAAGRSNPTTITLHMSSQLQHVSQVDNPPVGRSAGDVLVFTEKLLNTGGHAIGSDAATCTYLFDRRSFCTGAYILRSGQIMVQLIQPSLSGALRYDQAITGGTGSYAHATGTVSVDQRPSGDHFTFHIHLPAG